MRRLRIFRGGEHHDTVFREARDLLSFLKSMDDDAVQDGDILYYDNIYWRIEYGEPRQLSPHDPRVSGLYGKALRAELKTGQTKPRYLPSNL